MAIRFLSGQTIDGNLTVSGNVQAATFNSLPIATGRNNQANQIVNEQMPKVLARKRVGGRSWRRGWGVLAPPPDPLACQYFEYLYIHNFIHLRLGFCSLDI